MDDAAEIGCFDAGLAEEESGCRNNRAGRGQKVWAHGENPAEVVSCEADGEEEIDGGSELGKGRGNEGWVGIEEEEGIDAEGVKIE